MRLPVTAAVPFLILALSACGDDPVAAVVQTDTGTDTTDMTADVAADVVEEPLLVPEFGTEETRTIRGYATPADGLSRIR
jgi:hypothetical protein